MSQRRNTDELDVPRAERSRPARTDRVRGTLLILGSALSFSTIALFTRAISLPLPEMLVIRGVSGAVAIWIVARLFTQQRLLDRANFRWPALAVAVLFTVGMTSLVVAYRIGTVVNVSVIYATIPIVVAVIQLVVLRHRRPSPVFWVSAVGVVAGVAVMTGGGLSAGDVAGMGLALLMTFCVAGVILIARRHQDVPMLPASGIACLLSGLVALPFVTSFVVPADQLLLNALFGIVTLGLGRVFLVLGSGLVSSRTAALMDVLDAPMTPLWTLAVLGEVPTVIAVVGGVIVLVSVMAGIRFDRAEEET